MLRKQIMLRGFVTLIRPLNLIIMACMQAIILFSLGDKSFLFYNTNKTIALLLCTVFAAAAGYIINDYFDVKIDRINKPGKVIISDHVKRRDAIIMHWALNVLAVLLGFSVNIKVGVLVLLTTVLLYKYSEHFKKQYFIGNFVVALLSAFSVIMVWLYLPQLHVDKVIAYASFAFVISLIREIIKDIEDQKGDERFNCLTMAIVLGMRKTKRLTLIVIGLFSLILLYWAYSISAVGGYISTIGTGRIYFFYVFLFIIAPIIWFCIKLNMADTTKDFHQLSIFLKLLMLLGIGSMFFI